MLQKAYIFPIQPHAKRFFKAVFASDQGLEFAHRFSERIARFLQKNEQMSDSLKKTSDSLIFGERPERFAHGHSILVSDLSKSLMVAYF